MNHDKTPNPQFVAELLARYREISPRQIKSAVLQFNGLPLEDRLELLMFMMLAINDAVTSMSKEAGLDSSRFYSHTVPDVS